MMTKMMKIFGLDVCLIFGRQALSQFIVIYFWRRVFILFACIINYFTSSLNDSISHNITFPNHYEHDTRINNICVQCSSKKLIPKCTSLCTVFSTLQLGMNLFEKH